MQYVSTRWSFVATKELDNTDRPPPQLEEDWSKVELLLKRPQQNEEGASAQEELSNQIALQAD
jgi:hypothetical protein